MIYFRAYIDHMMIILLHIMSKGEVDGWELAVWEKKHRTGGWRPERRGNEAYDVVEGREGTIEPCSCS